MAQVHHAEMIALALLRPQAERRRGLILPHLHHGNGAAALTSMVDTDAIMSDLREQGVQRRRPWCGLRDHRAGGRPCTRTRARTTCPQPCPADAGRPP